MHRERLVAHPADSVHDERDRAAATWCAGRRLCPRCSRAPSASLLGLEFPGAIPVGPRGVGPKVLNALEKLIVEPGIRHRFLQVVQLQLSMVPLLGPVVSK